MFDKFFDTMDKFLDETGKFINSVDSGARNIVNNADTKTKLHLCIPGNRIKFIFMNKEVYGTVISTPFLDLDCTRKLVAVKLENSLKIVTKAKSWQMERVVISTDAIYV